MLEFWTLEEHFAQKDHMCDLCNTLIFKGTKYKRYSGKADGYFFDECYHMHCHNMIMSSLDYHGDDEYDSDSVEEFIVEEVCKPTCPCWDVNSDEYDQCETSPLVCPNVIKQFENIYKEG